MTSSTSSGPTIPHVHLHLAFGLIGRARPVGSTCIELKKHCKATSVNFTFFEVPPEHLKCLRRRSRGPSELLRQVVILVNCRRWTCQEDAG